MPPPPASWQYLRIYSPDGTCSGMLAIYHQQQVDLWHFDLESGVRDTCDVGYLCANFSLPRPLCSRVRSDVRDRQTDRQTSDDRQKHRLMPPPYGCGGIITMCVCVCAKWNFGTFCRTVQVKLHLDGRLYVPIGNEPEVLDDWPLHRAKQVHSTRLYVGACWQGALTNSSPIPSTVLPLYRPHRSLIGQLHLVTYLTRSLSWFV